jgi:hypothetical protein
MLPLPTGREASTGEGAVHYVRHRPERTSFINLLKDTIRLSCLIWRHRARHCRAMPRGAAWPKFEINGGMLNRRIQHKRR